MTVNLVTNHKYLKALQFRAKFVPGTVTLFKRIEKKFF